MGTLDEFLKGDEQPEETPETPIETAETPEAEEPKGQVRDEKGRFASKGETEAAPPAAEEPVTVPVKALQEERRKRQELEQQIAEVTQRIQQQPPQPAPDMWEDTQGWQQHFGSEVVSTAVQQATLNARLDMSEMMVRQAHPDFEDRKAAFIQLMNETPGLRERALNDAHPWNFAYNYVTNHERMQQLSAVNVTELEARLREEIKAELAAEQKAAPPIPDTLADAQSARGSTQAVHVPSFEEILKR